MAYDLMIVFESFQLIYVEIILICNFKLFPYARISSILLF